MTGPSGKKMLAMSEKTLLGVFRYLPRKAIIGPDGAKKTDLIDCSKVCKVWKKTIEENAGQLQRIKLGNLRIYAVSPWS